MDAHTHVTEILEETDEGQEIILEPGEEYEEGEEDEVEEIVEIIEEIEEVEEESEEGVHEVEHVVVEEDVHEPEQDQVPQNTSVSYEKSNVQICYDASADWEDDDVNAAEEEPSTSGGQYNTYVTYNNGVNDEVNAEIDERNQVHYEEPQGNSVVDENSQPEIIQSEENNLIYTVLGSKKSNQENTQVEFVEVW